MAFRFIHTADIHLDSPLKSLALRNQDLAEVVANATRQVLVRIVNLCLSEKVDALLIAGDLYDGEQTSMKTARFLASQIRRLDEANISVYIIRGNHDAESKITGELTLPERVHVFSGKAQAVVFDSVNPNSAASDQQVVIHGVSFKKPHAPESLLPQFQQPTPQAINIGMMHTSLDGSPAHDPYAPCSLADLQSHGFDYWALGHIHKRAVHETDDCTVVMPGIPQGRDIGESGEKTVTLVTIEDDSQVHTTEHLLAVAQFEELRIALNDTSQWQSAIDLVINNIESVFDQCHADHLVARVVLDGTTPLSWKLRRDSDLFVNELQSRLDDEDHLWLDKLIVQCEPPAETKTMEAAGPQSELHALMLEEINHSSNLITDAKLMMDALFKGLPGSLRSSFGENEIEQEKILKKLALEGSKQVTANLQADSATDEQEAN